MKIQDFGPNLAGCFRFLAILIEAKIIDYPHPPMYLFPDARLTFDPDVTRRDPSLVATFSLSLSSTGSWNSATTSAQARPSSAASRRSSSACGTA